MSELSNKDKIDIIDDLESSGWIDILKFIRDSKISRGKLIGENILLHDKLDKIKEYLNNYQSSRSASWHCSELQKILEEET